MKGLFTGKMQLWRRFSTKSRPTAKKGALCLDQTFKRVLGTPTTSEPVMKDLLNAMRFAQTGLKDTVQGVEFVDAKVRESVAPIFKRELLLVDVRVKDSDSTFIVEVQRQKKASFVRRCILYSSAEIVSQHLESLGQTSKLRPVHTLAFCDYDFGEGRGGNRNFGTLMTNERSSKNSQNSPVVSKAIQFYALESQKDALSRLGGIDNEMLTEEMHNRLSFVFALLPHAPRLEDLTADTHPLLRWAALIAHVEPEEIDSVPKGVRDIHAVKLMLDILHGSIEETKLERGRAQEEAARDQEEEYQIFQDGFMQGKAEGLMRILFQLKVKSAADYRREFGVDPPDYVAKALIAAGTST